MTACEDPEKPLRRRLIAHARTLPFPAAALLTDRSEDGDEQCTELMSIATVLSKSSGHFTDPALPWEKLGFD